MKSYSFLKRTYMNCRLAVKLFFFIFISLTAGLFAEIQQSDHVKAQIIPEVLSIRLGEPFCVALRLVMDEHWHTYWKNPGDSGLPTKIEWNLPDGFVAGDIQWPFPQKFGAPPVVSFGYEGEVFLLVEIKAPETMKPESKVSLEASVDWLVCKESCLPGHVDLKIFLPVKNEKPKIDEKWAARFAKTRKDLPRILLDWEIKAAAHKEKILIQINQPLWFNGELKDITFFPEQAGIVNYSGKQNLRKSRDGYIVEIQRSMLSKKLPVRLKGVLFSQKGWNHSQQERALYVDVLLHQY